MPAQHRDVCQPSAMDDGIVYRPNPRRHCSLIHRIPAPQQRSAVCRGQPLIHMILAPHQRLPCVEDIYMFRIYALQPAGLLRIPSPGFTSWTFSPWPPKCCGE